MSCKELVVQQRGDASLVPLYEMLLADDVVTDWPIKYSLRDSTQDDWRVMTQVVVPGGKGRNLQIIWGLIKLCSFWFLADVISQGSGKPIMCSATRFPKAKGLCRITDHAVVNGLVKVIRCLGCLKSSKGSGRNPLRILHCCFSAYHPESQGAVERFHQTLITKSCSVLIVWSYIKTRMRVCIFFFLLPVK